MTNYRAKEKISWCREKKRNVRKFGTWQIKKKMNMSLQHKQVVKKEVLLSYKVRCHAAVAYHACCSCFRFRTCS